MLSAVCRRCSVNSARSRATMPSTSSAVHVSLYPSTYIRASSSSSSSNPIASTPTPKKPSPCRLIPISTFLADFAPLHIRGWRLDNLPHVRHPNSPKEGGMVELQDRHLTRRYDFGIGRDGWRGLLEFVGVIGQAIEVEDVSLQSQ